MKVMQIELPDDLNLVELELKMSMASKLYDLGKISLGQGAKIVGLSKKAFMELLGEFGVSVFGYSEDELENDLSNV
jgi:predicted HTH domain antitoxin